MPILSTPPIFIAKQHQATLAHNQMLDFDAIWTHQMEWFEPPNEHRGGWSGVCKLVLQSSDGQVLDMFVKKQQNYGRRAKLPPYHIQPTFRREFNTMMQLEKMKLGAPKPVYYAERVIDNTQQAILITQTLSGAISLYDWIAGDKLRLQKRPLMSAIAAEIKRFHDAGFVHRALYAKHIFIKPVNQTFEIALIDFEKTRQSLWPKLTAISDLITLNYRTDFFSKIDRLYFYQCYFKIHKIGFLHKQLLAYIGYKSNQKIQGKTNK